MTIGEQKAKVKNLFSPFPIARFTFKNYRSEYNWYDDDGFGAHLMFGIRKSPFDRHEDPVEHMVALLSEEAANVRTPFSEEEKKILGREVIRGESIPEGFRQKAKKLIEQILKREQEAEASKDAKNFGNTLEWAGDPDYPNIVALTEEVVTEGRSREGLPRLHGGRWSKDRLQLIGCAFSVVLFMCLAVAVFGLIFAHR